MELQQERLCANCVQLNLAAIFDPGRFDSLPSLNMNSIPSSLDPEKSKEALQVEELMQTRHPPPKWIRHVGSWSPSYLNPSNIGPSCPFCCLLGDIVACGPSFWVGGSRELFAFPSHLLYDLADTSTSKPGAVPMPTYLLILSKKFLLINTFKDEEAWKDWLRRVCGEPFTTILLSSRAAPKQSGSVSSMNTRLLQGNSIDYD